MTDRLSKRVLGMGEYEARWVQRSNLIELTAKGILPCANYKAQLEKRPERVLPPMWDMIFFVEDVCLEAIKPFEVTVQMVADPGTTEVTVFDATGENRIPVQPAFEEMPERSFSPAVEADLYRVYARLPKKDDGPRGCMIVPADQFVIAIYYSAFGPASRQACENFMSDHCILEYPVFPQRITAGDEIPWPLAD